MGHRRGIPPGVGCCERDRAGRERLRHTHPAWASALRLFTPHRLPLPRVRAYDRLCARHSWRLATRRRRQPSRARVVRRGVPVDPARRDGRVARMVSRCGHPTLFAESLGARDGNLCGRGLGRAILGGALALARERVPRLLQEIISAFDARFRRARVRDLDHGRRRDLASPELPALHLTA